MPETIAVFGGTGKTGRYFVEAALEAGYQVRMLARDPTKVTTASPQLTVVEGDFSNTDALQSVIRGADYVVNMAGGKPGPDFKPFMKDLVQTIWPMMEKEPSVKTFLYQAGGFCPKPGDRNPWMMQVMRWMAGWIMGLEPLVADNDDALQFIDSHPSDQFQTIVTRPGRLVDTEGGATLEASVSTAPSGAVAFRDLAKFNLKAMKDIDLVGKYPFVVKVETVH